MNLECANEESSLPDAAASDKPHPQCQAYAARWVSAAGAGGLVGISLVFFL